MKTTYITFTREMARAYREGRKRMTRLVIKWPKWIQNCDYSLSRIAEIINSNDYRGIVKRGCCDGVEHQYRCPYGAPGDQLILGTMWAAPEWADSVKPSEIPRTIITGKPIPIWSYFDSDEKPEGFGKLRPGRFLPGFLRDQMPRETLKAVRAERVQEITVEDIIKEGLVSYLREHDACCDLKEKWIQLWNFINASRGYSWDSNPWVWVLEW